MSESVADEFVRAIADLGKAPCEVFACAKHAECAEKKLACQSFHHFVETGRSKSPHFRFEEPAKRKRPKWMFDASEIQATRRLYNAVFSGAAA